MKNFLKNCCDLLMLVLASPVAFIFFLEKSIIGTERAFPGWSQFVSLIPGTIGVYFRRSFYRLIFPRLGHGVCISFGTIFSHAACTIGRDTYVGHFCCLGHVELGDYVMLASHVSVANGTAQHGAERTDVPLRDQPGKWPVVHIGAHTWIGERAVIMADVGSHCIIGAGAVVTRPIPDYAVAYGVPARVQRMRTPGQLVNDPHAVVSVDD